MSAKLVFQSVLAVALLVCTAQALDIEMVPVGNPGNTADNTGYGAVDYEYRIGKYEITNGQWREFLNAVARTGDPHSLYDDEMGGLHGGIQRVWSAGQYVYSAKDSDANWDRRPVNFVNFWDVMRFCNWLHNGQGDGETESGAYIIAGNGIPSRDPDARYFIPTDSEWYKAAYHKNDGVTGNYWDYPTGTNIEPSNDLISPDPGNNANFIDYGGPTIGQPYYTTEVGEFEHSGSAYGTFDQAGNINEWTETQIDAACVLRGADWGSWAHRLAASYRYEPHPLTFDNAYLGFRVAAVPLVPGDLNDDGIVSSRDLDIVRAWWGMEVEPGDAYRGDANCDGKVNSADLDIVRSDWGRTPAAVPEPSVLFLLISGAVLLAWRRS